MSSAVTVIRGANPRRNLPGPVARKRTESNFLCAFERAYRRGLRSTGIAGRDFEVSGYGIADWVWIAWRQRPASPDATACALERRPPLLRLHAFELKISDWRKALKQAFRYGYFADRATVVLPPSAARLAKVHLDTFVRLRVGLWSFDASTGRILRIYSPRLWRPRNAQAKDRAVALILRRVNFSQVSKKLQGLA